MSPTPGSRYLAEFVGTFVLCVTVGCCAAQGAALAAVAATGIAFALTVTVYALAPVSGAHLNPAVTLALVASGCCSLETAGAFIPVQLAAGLLAGVTSWMVTDKSVGLAPAVGFSWWQAGLAELLFTMMLCFVVLNVTVRQRSGNQFFGIAIGFVIIAGGYAVGGVSGGALNPAVALSFLCMDLHPWRTFGWALTYWGFQVAGAALAALLFGHVRPDEDLVLAGATPDMSHQATAEFTGTFFLVLTVGLNVLSASPATAWSAAAALMCMIYALGDVSGGHFNPAVTLAVVASGREKIAPKTAGIFIGVQIAGGVAAGFVYALIHWGKTFQLIPGAYGEEVPWSAIATAEIIFTGVLCLTVLAVATRDTGLLKDFFGFAIATCVTAGGVAAGPVSGGYLNPAVSMGVSASHVLNKGSFYPCLVYATFQCIAAVLAAGSFRILYPSEYPKPVNM